MYSLRQHAGTARVKVGTELQQRHSQICSNAKRHNLKSNMQLLLYFHTNISFIQVGEIHDDADVRII